jgi:hypothetical protein
MWRLRHFTTVEGFSVLLSLSAGEEVRVFVMAGLRPGHPRLPCLKAAKKHGRPGIADKFT